ncbi:MAG: VIT and VWA domain-containing protein [Elusimicrobiota bacterium]
MKTTLIRRFIATTLLGAWLAPQSQAQQIIAWPIGGQTPLRILLPGNPVRPLPILPLPRPTPRPSPFPPRPAPQPDGTTPLDMSGYRVEGSITDSAAELSYTITFHNPTDRRLEGVLLIPIPANTVLSGFKMQVGDRVMNGELLEAGKAATIYENIVRQMRDPGLLELVGERMVRAKVFPIEPRSDVVVRTSLTQVLSKSGTLYSLTVPTRSARMSNAEASPASVRLRLSAKEPLRTLYSPTPGARISRNGERGASIEYEAKNDDAGDFTLFYGLDRDPLSAGLLAFRESGEDGFFMLNFSPKRESAGPGIPKDVVFILDRSGSMEDAGKMKQAKEALGFCIRRLRAQDRFGIVDFATDTGSLESELLAATEENKTRALRYVSKLEAGGGTNIEQALRDALALMGREKERMRMAFFLTDGLPTVGQNDTNALLRTASESNKDIQTRVFAFGLGNDVNTLFLDKLAEGNRGAQDYVRPGESIEDKVSSLYKKVSEPALTDVRVQWRGVEAADVYPRKPSDIFHGGELVLMGRFKSGGKGSVVVTGRADGRPARFVYPVELPNEESKNAFLPRLWANLKVAHELDAIRLSGSPSQEVIDTIVRLAKRYGIVTPYTSFLITEETPAQPAANLDSMRRRMEAQAARLHQDAFESGRGNDVVTMSAQKASDFFAGYRGARMRVAAADESLAGSFGSAMSMAEHETRGELKRAGVRATQTRSMAGKTFYLRGGVWVDGEIENSPAASRKTVSVRTMSEEYFKLLASVPGLAKYLSLGHAVKVCLGGVVYETVE